VDNERADARMHVARTLVHAVIAGDVGSCADLLAEDVVYRVEGRNAFSGHFSGRAEALTHMRKLMCETTSGVELVKLEDWLSSEGRVVSIVRHRIHYEGKIAQARRIVLFEFNPDDEIGALSVFTEDQANFDAMVGPDRAP
jgi:hypothetical protein